MWYAPFHCNFTKWDTSSSYGIESSQSTPSRSTPIPKESFFIPSIRHVFPTKRFIFLPVTYHLLQIRSTHLPTDSSYSHPHQPLLTASISPSHPQSHTTNEEPRFHPLPSSTPQSITLVNHLHQSSSIFTPQPTSLLEESVIMSNSRGQIHVNRSFTINGTVYSYRRDSSGSEAGSTCRWE